MSKIDFSKRQSRTSQRITKWFKTHRNEPLSLGEIIDKYCKIGMSRKHVVELLMNMKNHEGRKMKEYFSFSDTSLWDAWKIEVHNKRCNFIFKAMFKGNPYHGNKGKIYEKNKNKEVKYHCQKCGNIKTLKTKIEGKRKLIGLRGHQCLKCGEYGTCIGIFYSKGKQIIKTLINNKEEILIPERMISNETHSNHS